MNQDTIYKDFYPLYGKFSIEYENMINTVKTLVVIAISDTDLKKKSLGYILVDRESATGIIKKFSAMLSIIYESEKRKSEICHKLLGKIKAIIEYRNKIIHSSWIYGPKNGDEKDITVPYLFEHAQSEKKGYHIKISELNAERLNVMTERVIEAKRLLYCIQSSFINEKIDFIDDFQNSNLLK